MTNEPIDSPQTAIEHQPREARDVDDIGGKLLDFLSKSMTETGTRRVMRVELKCVSDGYRTEPLEAWARDSNPELFDKLAYVESMVAKIVELCEQHVDASGEASVFEIKTRAYDQSTKYRKVKVAPSRRPYDERSMLLPNETPTSAGSLALQMRHNAQMMAQVELNNRNAAALNRASMEAVLQILKETRDENAQLRAERKEHLAQLEAARSEEADRDMKFAAQEESDKRRMILTNKFAMVLPVLAHAIASKLGQKKKADQDAAGGAEGGEKPANAGDAAAAKPRAKSPLELALVQFMETLTDEQMQAIRSMLSVEQAILLGAALDAAEAGGSPLLSTMVKDFVESFQATPEKFSAILEYLTPDQRTKLLAVSQLARQAAQQ
jgi:hypothetical protein